MAQEDAKDVCDACGTALEPDSKVLQVVQDRFPTYDREVVLATYHPRCWNGRGRQTVECDHCGNRFRLTLLEGCEQYQNLSRELFCPFCGTMFSSEMGF